MITLKQAAQQFSKQLKKEYEKGMHILTCFQIYLGFLVEYCNNENESKRYGQFSSWQIKDMLMCIHNDKINPELQTLETFLLYTRRGGKTKNLTVIAVFFSILGYLVMWRSSYTDQLNMAKYWFLKNPFVLKVIYGQTDNHVKIINSENLSFDVIAAGKTQSRGVDVIIIDEECMIVADSAKYDVYEKLRPCLADSKFKHFIHGTTPELNTVAETNYFFLKDQEVRMQTLFTAERDYHWCDWITEEFIETERILHEDDPYYVAMQYELQWTVLGGKVFNNVIRVGDPSYSDADGNLLYPIGFLDKFKPTHAGVDFNGDINKHYIGTVKFDDQFIYCLEETQFTDLNKLFEYHRCSLELEDGMYNNQFTKQTREMGLRCIYNLNWHGENGGDKKMIRVQELRKRKIIINKQKCPQLWKNLNECAWNRKKLRTEIIKTKDQHGLDWLLHAVHNAAGEVYISQRGTPSRKIIRPRYI